MKSKKVLRYYADCGRGFWKKQSCIEHEKRCVCWSNPKNRTCKTCKYGEQVNDSNGMESEPHFLETWQYTECKINIDSDSIYWNQKNKKISDININCQKWEPNV